jgi:hypothetical protein
MCSQGRLTGADCTFYLACLLKFIAYFSGKFIISNNGRQGNLDKCYAIRVFIVLKKDYTFWLIILIQVYQMELILIRFNTAGEVIINGRSFANVFYVATFFHKP